jgi:hypothetical protein
MAKRHFRKLGTNGGFGEVAQTAQLSVGPTAIEFDWRTADPQHLPRELGIYASVLDHLLSRKDDYVLIKGEDVIGIFPNREEAIGEAINRFGAEPVLIKRIVATEPILEIGHVCF